MGQTVQKTVSYSVGASKLKSQGRIDKKRRSAALGLIWACLCRRVVSASAVFLVRYVGPRKECRNCAIGRRIMY